MPGRAGLPPETTLSSDARGRGDTTVSTPGGPTRPSRAVVVPPHRMEVPVSDVPRIRDPRTGVTFPAHLARTDREKRLVQRYLEGLPRAQRIEATFTIEKAMSRPIQVTATVVKPVYSPWTDATGGEGRRPTTRDLAGHLVVSPDGPPPVADDAG